MVFERSTLSHREEKCLITKARLVIVMFFQQKVLVITQSEVLHIIQERMKELQELKHNVDVLKVRSDIAYSNMSSK